MEERRGLAQQAGKVLGLNLSGMDEPLDSATPVPTAASPGGGARTPPPNDADDGLEAWLADRRWRAALEGYPCLPEASRP